jgi:hypothetical protein
MTFIVGINTKFGLQAILNNNFSWKLWHWCQRDYCWQLCSLAELCSAVGTCCVPLAHVMIGSSSIITVLLCRDMAYLREKNYLNECYRMIYNLQLYFPGVFMYIFYFTLVRSKLEYAALVWNTIMSTDAHKLERIQQKFTSVCFYHFFPRVPCTYTVAMEKLGLRSLWKRRHYLDAFFIQVYCDLKSCTSLLENVSLHSPPINLLEFSLFFACPILLLGAPMLPTDGG